MVRPGLGFLATFQGPMMAARLTFPSKLTTVDLLSEFRGKVKSDADKILDTVLYNAKVHNLGWHFLKGIEEFL
jgi:hypothetical protein